MNLRTWWHIFTSATFAMAFVAAFRGKWWQLNPSKNESMSLQLTLPKKDAAGLEMFRLVFQETYLTLPLCSSGILKPISILNTIWGVIFHVGYDTEKKYRSFFRVNHGGLSHAFFYGSKTFSVLVGFRFSSVNKKSSYEFGAY